MNQLNAARSSLYLLYIKVLYRFKSVNFISPAIQSLSHLFVLMDLFGCKRLWCGRDARDSRLTTTEVVVEPNSTTTSNGIGIPKRVESML